MPMTNIEMNIACMQILISNYAAKICNKIANKKMQSSRGVHCTKHVRVYMSAHKGYYFEYFRITYT